MSEFIPSLLLMQMLRRLRSHHQRISPIQKSFYQIKSSRKIHFNEDLDRKEEFSMRFPW